MSLEYDISDLPKYITARGIRYVNELKLIRMSGNSPMQPVYEAFMNAWESAPSLSLCEINIRLVVRKASILPDESAKLEFVELSITDNGEGLTDENLNRLLTLRDDSKGRNNRGTGRVQYMHYFEETIINSVFAINEKHRHRKIELSKSDVFLANNAFAKMLTDEECNEDTPAFTEVLFRNLLKEDRKKYYSQLDSMEIKEQLLNKFFPLFYEHREELPKITICRHCEGKELDVSTICSNDITPCDKETPFKVSFKTKINNTVKTLSEKAEFNLRSFRFSSTPRNKNKILLISKGAVAESMNIDMLPQKESLEGERYLFMVSGEYIDANDSDTRGELGILSDAEVKKMPSSDLLQDKFITIEDIRKETNNKINVLYPAIASIENKKFERIEALKKLFLLDNDAVNEVSSSVSCSDSDEKILNRIYEYEGEKKAKLSAKLKQEIDNLDAMSTTDEDYQQKLMDSATRVVEMVPLHGKNDLAQYIARRKLVLSLFEKIMQNATSENVDEAVLHNLFFTQHSNNTAESDMWILNEEFIYFNGCSENKLSEVEYLGQKLFKEEFSEEENRILHEDGQDRTAKRPDVLLFPEEGKCIIIEFKAPHVPIAKHLQQISDYAGMLRNYTRDDVELMQFYGYLIGENINYRDVRRADSDFMPNATGESLFRARKPVAGEDGRLHKDGTLYTEVIKYSEILERAKLRTRIFMQKLGLEEVSSAESTASENN